MTTLRVGASYRVKKLGSDKDFRRKLTAMSILPGCSLRIDGMAPMGGPIRIEVNNAVCLSLRKEELATLQLEIITA